MGFNAEIVAGLTILLLGIIFIFAGLVNTTWGEIMLADFVIIALGLQHLELAFGHHVMMQSILSTLIIINFFYSFI